VGFFPSATRVRKNTNAIRGLRSKQNAKIHTFCYSTDTKSEHWAFWLNFRSESSGKLHFIASLYEKTNVQRRVWSSVASRINKHACVDTMSNANIDLRIFFTNARRWRSLLWVKHWKWEEGKMDLVGVCMILFNGKRSEHSLTYTRIHGCPPSAIGPSLLPSLAPGTVCLNTSRPHPLCLFSEDAWRLFSSGVPFHDSLPRLL